jgi:hypothetical protein
VSEADQARAAAALQEAFIRMQPQGSDAWNFLGAFTQLLNLYGPYRPDALGLSKVLLEAAPAAGSGWRGRAARLRPKSEQASPSGDTGELHEAMGHVVEAFRFLSARVQALEDRLAREDRPIDGAAWLAPARELGPWVEPVSAHVLGEHPGGEVVHGDCGTGELVLALTRAGLAAHGVEPRGAVALAALEQGCAVSINEVTDHVAARPADSLGGLVLSGVVDRLALHELLVLLAGARRSLAAGAPLVVVVDPGDPNGGSAPVGRELVGGSPLHTQTWEILLDRAGFTGVALLPGADDGRVAITAIAPT